ncbi:hypothetical protein Nepgr_030688 [Nepenthes gracilis]|uniref:HMG box domain-containing protein n=1 Tax=Nepenthes gracilis TaxID=150966 RepID=A0AAD3Y620_NEPGR|nr:hypothetical protein Nepgr_030688 [Nepenthes gracilis]
MAANEISRLPLIGGNPLPAKKGKSRKPLKQKNTSSSGNEANILAGKFSQQGQPAEITPPFESDPQKENHESINHPCSGKKSNAKAKGKQCFEKDLREMQDMLDKLRFEKEKTEELLKEKDVMLKIKEEELETRDTQQQKLQMEIKRLQKLKEFKPVMTFLINEPQKNILENKLKKKKTNGSAKRKPLPPYILWCKDHWNEVKRTNPDAEFKEISSILGAKWKTISPEEKQPYEEKYKAEKEIYLQFISKEKRENEAMKLLKEEKKQKTAMELLDQYLQFKQEMEKENKNKKAKKEKDPLKPKQPMSAFFLFTNERRSALLEEGKNLLEVSKVTSEEWKNMTEEQKRPYEEAAKASKEKYLQDMELYKKMKEEGAANLKREEEEQMKIQKHEALQLLKKKERNENMIKQAKEKKKPEEGKNVDPNKPKRPPSSFILFRNEARKNLLQERKGINNSTLNAIISVKWKELVEEKRQIWNEKAADRKEAYKKELEEYKKKKEAASKDK